MKIPRREFLLTVSGGVSVGLAGCLDIIEDENADNTENNEEQSNNRNNDGNGTQELSLDLQENAPFTVTTSNQEGHYFPSGVEWSVKDNSDFVVVDERAGSIVTFNQKAETVNIINDSIISDGLDGLIRNEINNEWYAPTHHLDRKIMTIFDTDWNIKRQISYDEEEISLRGGMVQSNDGTFYTYDRALFELDNELQVQGIEEEFNSAVGGLVQLSDGNWLIAESTSTDEPSQIHLSSDNWEILSTVELDHVNPVGGLLVDDENIFVFHQFWGSADVQNASISKYNYNIKK